MVSQIKRINKKKFLTKLLTTSIVLLVVGCSESNIPAWHKSEATPGGTMTAKRLSTLTFVNPGKAASSTEKLNFWTGFSLFKDPWVIAPSSTADRDGLGPLFNTRSCVSCHIDGSRGFIKSINSGSSLALVIKLGLVEKKLTANSLIEDPVYGDQIQTKGIPFKHAQLSVMPFAEASLEINYEKITGEFLDGTEYELLKPSYQLTDLAYGELAENIGLSPRLAPNIFGAGLLDAIRDEDLLSQEDINDSDNNGISAKYNRVMNYETGELALGRFAFKARHPNLQQQVAAAFRNDIGITSTLFPEENCTAKQLNCQQAAVLGTSVRSDTDKVEISDKLLALVVSFNQLLAVPPARNLIAKDTMQGRALFYQLGCQQCHTPSYQTDINYKVAVLANQRIWPYTDLALHDMGRLLSDNVNEVNATGQEWRTPPLWGIGLQKKVVGQQRFLHDGRARNITEAILWHGGEAENIKQRFVELDQFERQALVKFLSSI
ncbi:MAG: hypothetical protein MJK12_06135 [Colwellia sp.]|nr:hypothetical protein [Colwellia sp.]